RPAHLITILCNDNDIEKMSNIIFEETSSIGVRIDTRQRICLNREIKTIETKYGRIRFKLAYKDGKIVNVQPEYEDIKNASAKHNLPFKTVRDYAVSEYYNSLK
ncbi:MAG: nickel insertion protein, partial [Armatimonadota bacterium]